MKRGLNIGKLIKPAAMNLFAAYNPWPAARRFAIERSVNEACIISKTIPNLHEKRLIKQFATAAYAPT